jgi:hypothetical protein
MMGKVSNMMGEWHLCCLFGFLFSHLNIPVENKCAYKRKKHCAHLFGFESHSFPKQHWRGRRCHDCMIVGYTTTYAIGANHHWCCGLSQI